MTSLDLTESIAPRSDQLNAEHLLVGPYTVTISEVRKGTGEQPFDFHLVEFPGKPFRPSKTVRRLLVHAWGVDANAYAGRRLTLYRDPEVKFGGQAVGGIRVSHMSHIDKPFTIALTETRGKRASHTVKPLPADAPPTAPLPAYMEDARAAKTLAEWREVWQRAKDAGHLTDALKAELVPLGEALKTEPVADAEPTLPGAES